MLKKIIYVSLFVLVLLLAVQSVSASDTDSNTIYSNDINLDNSLGDSGLSGGDDSLSDSESTIENHEKSLVSSKMSDSSNVNEDNLASDESINENNLASEASIDEDDVAIGGSVDENEIVGLNDNNIDGNDEIIANDNDLDNLKEDSSAVNIKDAEDERNATEIHADSIAFDYGSKGELKINFTDKNGLGLSGKTILVKINGIQSNLTTNSNGVAVFKYSGAAGAYAVNLSFKGDESYAPSNASAKITINKLATKLKVPSVRSYLTNTTYVVATLTDSKGHSLSNKVVYLVISGKTYKANTNKKGIAKIKIPTKICNLTVSVKFGGDKNYTASSANAKVLITKMKTKISVPKVKLYFTENTCLKITLKNAFGKALAKKPITVKIAKRTYKLTTDANGVSKLNFKKKASRFKCIIKFKATNTYYGASKTAKVTVSKMPTVIKAPKITFKSSKYGIFKVNLSDVHGKPLKNKVVSISIPSLKKVYKVKTNSKGIATLKFSGPNSHKVIVKYAGNKNYAAKKVNSKLVIKRVKVKLNDVIGAAKLLKEYVSENKSLPSKVRYKNYAFTTEQLSYIMAVAIDHIHKKNKADILVIAASNPSKASGEIYDTVYKKDYLKVVKKAMKSKVNHKTPAYIKHSFYKVPYAVYTAEFSRILNFYSEHKKLPNYSLFTSSEFVKVKNSSKYTFYLTTDNIAGKKSDLKMLKQLAKALRSKGYQAVIVGIGPDIHNIAYRYGCTGKNSVLLACFGGVDVGCIEEWTGELSVGGSMFVQNYDGAHVLGLWYSKPYGASANLHKPVGRAWDANYGFALKNPAKYMSKHKISYMETGTVSSACKLLKEGKMGGPKLIQ